MKLPITENFLWGLYEIAENIDDILYIGRPRTWSDILCPDLKNLRRDYVKRLGRKGFSSLISHLKRQGYIRTPNLEGSQGLILTRRGLEKIKYIAAKSRQFRERADKNWIMVVFDIPEKRRGIREIFRRELRMFGFDKLQKSVWLTRFDILDHIQNLIKKYNLIDNVDVFIIAEAYLRKNFKE